MDKRKYLIKLTNFKGFRSSIKTDFIMEKLKLKIDLPREFASIIMNNDVNHYNLLQTAVEYYKGESDEEYKILETFCDKFNIVYDSLKFNEIEFLYKAMDKAINVIMSRYNVYHLI